MQAILELLLKLAKEPLVIDAVGSFILIVVGTILEGKYFPIRRLLRRILGVTQDAERLLKEFKDVVLELDRATKDNEITIEEVGKIRKEANDLVEALEEILIKYTK